MSDVLQALVALADGVRLWFNTTQPALGVFVAPVGTRERVKTTNEGTGRANRIVFMPGTITGGDVPDTVDFGSLLRGKKVNFNPRTLWEWDIPFTMSVWAADTSSAAAANDEQKQLVAVTNLLELAMRAVHLAVLPVDPNDATQGVRPVGLATLQTPIRVRLVTGNRERALGRELLVLFPAIQSPLFDKTYDVATPVPTVRRDPPA